MRGVIFFVCLCFLFSRGYDIVYMGMPGNDLGNATHDITKTQQVKFPGKYILGEDFEDDDDDHPLVYNDKTGARRFVVNDFRNCLKVRLSFNYCLCYKYITQRALRI